MFFYGALGILNAPATDDAQREKLAAVLERCLAGLASVAESGP